MLMAMSSLKFYFPDVDNQIIISMCPSFLFLFCKWSFTCTEKYEGMLGTAVSCFKEILIDWKSPGNISCTDESLLSCNVLITSPTFLKMWCAQKGRDNEEKTAIKHRLYSVSKGRLISHEIISVTGPSQKNWNLNTLGSTTVSYLEY